MAFLGSIGNAVSGLFGSVNRAAGGEARGVAELAYKQDQANLIKELQNRMAGGAPSIADISTQQNVQQGLGATLGAINSARGTSPGLRARLGAQASQDAQNEIARQGTLARLQEQNQNVANLANVIQGAQAAQMGREKMISDADQAAKENRASLIGSAGKAAAAAGLLSDENAKKQIEPSDGKARDFLEVIKPKVYEYKDEANGEGKQLGIIAQDLEKSELGKAMIKETPEGKQVDFGKGFGAVLAAVAEINQKLNEIEKKKA